MVNVGVMGISAIKSHNIFEVKDLVSPSWYKTPFWCQNDGLDELCRMVCRFPGRGRVRQRKGPKEVQIFKKFSNFFASLPNFPQKDARLRGRDPDAPHPQTIARRLSYGFTWRGCVKNQARWGDLFSATASKIAEKGNFQIFQIFQVFQLFAIICKNHYV